MAEKKSPQIPEVILFFGTFNPMHVGHLCLCNFVAETHPDAEVWIVLTGDSPFKQDMTKLPVDLRAEWIRHLLNDYPPLRLCLDELTLPHPHYTYRTLSYFAQRYPEKKFTLLIGMDSLIDLPTWKEGKTLIHYPSILVYPRPGYDMPEWANDLPNVRLVDAPTMEISSTRIRLMIREGMHVPYFLHTTLHDSIYLSLCNAIAALPAENADCK